MKEKGKDTVPPFTVTVDFHVLIGVEHTAVGLYAVAFGRRGLDLEGDALGRRVADGERHTHVVLERATEDELVGRVEHEAAVRVDRRRGAAY